MKILGIIPARGGSKGIKKKNIIDCGGKPLIFWSIQMGSKLVKNKVIERCIVSSDSQEIIDIALEYDADIPFKRNKEIASDQSKAVEYVLEALERLKDTSEYYDAVLILQPTCPIRNYKDMLLAKQIFISSKADSLISCYLEDSINFTQMYFPKENKTLQPYQPLHNKGTNRQLHKPYMVRNGSIYLTKVDFIKENKTLISNNPYYLKMDKLHSINIDSQEDLELARKLI